MQKHANALLDTLYMRRCEARGAELDSDRQRAVFVFSRELFIYALVCKGGVRALVNGLLGVVNAT